MTTYQFLFHNTLGAISLKKRLQEAHIPFEIMDAPRELTSGCGLSIRFEWQKDITAFIVNEQTASIYTVKSDNYALVWRDNN